MMRVNVKDISRADMMSSNYDVLFLGLGYEPRCVFVSNVLEQNKIERVVVFSFNESKGNISRIHSRDVILHKWIKKTTLVELEHSNVKDVYEVLGEVLALIKKDEIKILIDYSSMSRNWYSAMLNYLMRFFCKKVTIDMVYSSAEYPKNDDFYDFVLGDVKILPGCEGSSITKKKKCAIFMLGFDKIGPQSFYNLIEPELTFGVIASPGAHPDYEDIALNINKDFIDHQLLQGKNLLKLPMSSMSVTFESLCQLIRPLKDEYNISVIQFGPKPQIVASTLAGIYFDNVSCLYSEYNRSKPFDVKHNGELIISRIVSDGFKE